MFPRALSLCLLVILPIGCSSYTQQSTPDDDFGSAGSFSLTDQGGQPFGSGELRDKIWVAAFIFTRCAGPCSQVSGCMARLQHDLAKYPDAVLVSFSVDPEFDTPKVLADYASRYQADPQRWKFLTGQPATVYDLIRNGFHLTAQQNKGTERTPGNEVMHDTRLVLVDGKGRIRGYFQATEADAVTRLEERVALLERERR